MDNLETILHGLKDINENDTGKILVSNLEGTVCCFSTDKNHVYLCLDLNDDIVLIGENIQHIKHLQYLAFQHILFLTNEFDIIIYAPSSKKFIVVYSFPVKIVSLSWNPTETYLVVIDNDQNIYGFTFESNNEEYIFTEVNKAHINCAVPNSVYVGWGSQNSQFRGVNKDKKAIIEEIPQEYSPPVISWRGNGEQFVINFWNDGKRYLKVFNSLLKAQYQSAIYPNLLFPTSFKGQGNFIACSAIHNGQNKIIIFEKNCLVKSEFFVPENKGQVINVLYHPEMNILAVCSREESGYSYLNIYLYSNGKWYLKQQLLYPPNKEVKCFQWVNNFEKLVCRLNVLTSENLEHIVFRMTINRSPTCAVVAVIDGVKVDFSFFDFQIVPPPMSSVFVKCNRPINRTFFHPRLKYVLLVDSAYEIKIINFENNSIKEAFSGSVTSLNEYSQTCNIKDILDYFKEYFLDSSLTFNFLPFNDTTELVPPLDMKTFTDNFIIYCTGCMINKTFYEFAIDHKQDLLINKSVVCHNILSLFIYDNYLFLTHASCKLYCIQLTMENLKKLSWCLDEFYSREIEQGSKIVCVTNKAEIVLILPRGNLETISCRVICIDMLEELLLENKWKSAVNMIRQQRLDCNLLIDLNPKRFLAHIEDFVEAAQTQSVLNSLILELCNGNCLHTTYSHCVSDRILILSTHSNKKEILLEILKCLSLNDSVSNLVSIVGLQVKHFTLKAALKSVLTIFECGYVEICNNALKHILLYHEPMEVINASFTLYNIPFMGLVYLCCSEDPKFFEPELERLKPLNEFEQRFQMNMLCKNYKSATKYLIRCDNYDHNYITEFLFKHNTFDVAYESVTINNPNFTLCSKLYANYLSKKSKHDEAGLILKRANLHEDALEEYRKALNWPEVLSLLVQLKIGESERKEIITNVAEGLLAQKRIDECVMLYEHYCGEYRKAIDVLLDMKMFQKALCMAPKYHFHALIDDEIRPSIEKYRSALNDRIIELRTKLVNYVERLEQLRRKKIIKLKHKELGDQYNNSDDEYGSEYGSIVSSKGSFSSNKSKLSTASAKSRKKLEKRKIDTREGGPYEDIALIRQLHLLITEIYGCSREVREICLLLADGSNFENNKILHRNLVELQELAKASIPQIWSEVFLNSPESSQPEVVAIIQNKQELDIEYRTPPPLDKLDDNWRLLIFK